MAYFVYKTCLQEHREGATKAVTKKYVMYSYQLQGFPRPLYPPLFWWDLASLSRALVVFRDSKGQFPYPQEVMRISSAL